MRVVVLAPAVLAVTLAACDSSALVTPEPGGSAPGQAAAWTSLRTPDAEMARAARAAG